jgi:diketogulonate reductase-like aldo/keto reductase
VPPVRISMGAFSVPITRRSFVQATLYTLAGATAAPIPGWAQAGAFATRRIPSTSEEIPAVGLGTWITFNVGDDPVLRNECAAVMAAFFAAGGGMIDSSPMYGSSQPVIGYGLEKLSHPPTLLSADKVWTSSGNRGPAQIEQSRRYWGVPKFDLLQVHNLRAWEAHLPTLQEMKAAGRLRYVGITTSHGRRHDLFEQVMRSQPLDFVQFTYNVVDREAENRILPLARDRGLGVIVNRPFQQGALIERLRGEPLPEWSAEIDASSWAQFILKFILSHPAVTTVIPATTRVDHVRENKAAAEGTLPDEAMRRRMAAYVRDL